MITLPILPRFVMLLLSAMRVIGLEKMAAKLKIKYSEYYVAFLDVLGFKDLVLNESKIELLDKYLNSTKIIIDEVKSIKSDRELNAIAISDSIILSVPFSLHPTEKYDNLRRLCATIQKIQFDLSLDGIWLRGAISIGNAYVNNDENIIVGPAYVNAYLLEERLAIHPRVILDSKIIGKLGFSSAQELVAEINKRHDNQEYKPAACNVLYEWYHHGHLKYGLEKDVPLFIDYMAFCFEQDKSLADVVNSIEKCMYAKNEVYLKYRWVVDYLISSCIHHNNHILKIDCAILREQLDKLKKL